MKDLFGIRVSLRLNCLGYTSRWQLKPVTLNHKDRCIPLSIYNLNLKRVNKIRLSQDYVMKEYKASTLQRCGWNMTELHSHLLQLRLTELMG